MSWPQATRDAEQWLDRLQLKRPAIGQTLDLRPFANRLPFTGRYRDMVINAIRRIMKRRRIDVTLPK